MEPIRIAFDLGPLLPQMILTAGGLLLLAASLLRRDEGYAPYLALVVLAVAAAACASLWEGPASGGSGLATDPFTLGIQLLLLVAAAMACLISAGYLGPQYELRAEYYGLLLFATLGMTVLAAATNFIALFLGLEVFSLAFYLLCGFTRDRLPSLESAMKYFLLGAFSSGFILYGMALIYGSTRTLELERVGEILLQRQAAPGVVLLAGLGLLLVGLAFKIGIVPFHFWIPDVYEGAPASVTAFMAAATKVAAFGALLRVLHLGFAADPLAVRWEALLGILAAATMTVANVIALTQTHIKRLLAYSSVAHAGYLLLAVATGTIQGVESLVFYLAAYLFANLGAFAVVVAVGRGGPEAEEGYRLTDYVGLGRRRPLLAAAMTAFLLSLTGIPPTAGFLGKWLIFRSAVDADLLGLAVVLAVNSAIAAFYYLGVVVQMYMVEPDAEPAPVAHSIPLAVATAVGVAVTFYLGIFPGRFLDLVSDMASRFWGTLHLI